MTLKKFFTIFACVMIVVLLLFSLSIPQPEYRNTVTFYYARAQFAYGEPDGVIGSEQRDIGGHEEDLNYLLGLYLEGPMDSFLVSPFPKNTVTRILSLKRSGDTLEINLSDLSSAMTDSQFSLACACLTRTCLGLQGIHAVQINSGSRSLRMNAGNIRFYDESASVNITETEERK